jgi:tetratricopeptide (TPR) repeat protein
VGPRAAAVAPRFLESEDHARNAAAAEPERRGEDADRLWEAAAAANALDPDPAVRRALREFQRWTGNLGSDPADETRRTDLVLTILEDAHRRRPLSASIEARLAEVHEAVARRLRERPATGIEGAAAGAHQGEAERHARLAVDLYPTRAYHRYLLGRILDAAGQAEPAAAEFREALRLSSLALRVPRLRLDGVQAAFATLKTGGRRERAIEIFKEWRRMQAEQPGFEERWRHQVPHLTPGEKSIVDAASLSK